MAYFKYLLKLPTMANYGNPWFNWRHVTPLVVWGAHQDVGVERKSGGSLECEQILPRQENVAELLNLWNSNTRCIPVHRDGHCSMLYGRVMEQYIHSSNPSSNIIAACIISIHISLQNDRPSLEGVGKGSHSLGSVVLETGDGGHYGLQLSQ